MGTGCVPWTNGTFLLVLVQTVNMSKELGTDLHGLRIMVGCDTVYDRWRDDGGGWVVQYPSVGVPGRYTTQVHPHPACPAACSWTARPLSMSVIDAPAMVPDSQLLGQGGSLASQSGRTAACTSRTTERQTRAPAIQDPVY